MRHSKLDCVPVTLQYCGGTSFVAKICEMLQPSSDTPTVLLDMFGFDAWPGSYAISQAARGSLECIQSLTLACSAAVLVLSVLVANCFQVLTKSHLRKKDCVCYGVSRKVNCGLC